MDRNGRAGKDNFEPTKAQGSTLPIISGSRYKPVATKVVAVRRAADNPPRDAQGRENWDASTPDPFHPDQRWFWLFLKYLVIPFGIIGLVANELGIDLLPIVLGALGG